MGTDKKSMGVGQFKYNVTQSRSAETVGGKMAKRLLEYADTTNQSATELVTSLSVVHMGKMHTTTKGKTLSLG